jgi:aspartyl-tRNA(Asn)/glutamyl-tRNA(Gln) amidotransferase subunit A
MAMGSSLDVIGPITKNVEDAEIVFSVIKGKDRYDATSFDISIPDKNKKYKRVADLSDFIEKIGRGSLSKEVVKNYQDSLERFGSMGYEIIKPKTDLSALTYALPTYYIIMPAEVSTNLARFDGVRFGHYKDSQKNLIEDYKQSRGSGFGKEARRRILLGAYVLSSGYYDAYYGKATEVRALIKKAFDEVFKEVDFVTTPTTPTPAFKFGEKMADPLQMYLADIFTVTANMSGGPAISIPSGFVKIEGKDLPLGLQVLAPFGKDFSLFEVSKNFLSEK